MAYSDLASFADKQIRDLVQEREGESAGRARPAGWGWRPI